MRDFKGIYRTRLALGVAFEIVCCLIIAMVLLDSCSNYTTEQAAKEYCTCLKSHYPALRQEQKKQAQKCNELIKKKYYYHRVFTTPVNDSTYSKLMQSTKDSAVIFETRFNDATDKYCCKGTWRCD